MSYLPQNLDKRAAWKRLFDWDFGAFDEFTLSPAETGITNAVVTVAGGDGQLVLGAPTISGTKVQILVSGGSPGVSYTVTVSVNTVPTNYQLNCDGIITVRA